MERLRTGISGLDEMLGGGIPKGHSIAVIGSFGTGKSTFAMQFIWEGLINGEKCIFMSLEEDEESLLESAKAFGWDFSKYINNNLLLLKLDPEDAKSSVERLEGDIPELIKEFGASRVAIDSISLITMMYRDLDEKRRIVFKLSKSIKESGATAILTAEVDPRNPEVSRDGIVEYVVDGVILLSFLQENNRLKLALRILKMRRTAHSREVKLYEIGENGINVLAEADVF
ncbi:KaiC domain-containing protein [Euryarchaeota archaeon ex4484_178]|nr:MAG: KaiC domain-containing protein [Euryarchaeota archaeon ex4484_178]